MALLLLPKKSQVFKDIQDKSGSEWISHAFGWRCSSIKEVVQLLSKHNFDNRNLSYCYRKVKQGTYDIAFYLHGKEKPRKNLGNGRLVTDIINGLRSNGRAGVLIFRNKGVYVAYPLIDNIKQLLIRLGKPSYRLTEDDKKLIKKSRPFLETLKETCDYGDLGIAVSALLEGKRDFNSYDLGLETDCKLIEAIDTETGEVFISHRDKLDRLPISPSGYVFCRYHDTLSFPQFRNFISRGMLEDDA